MANNNGFSQIYASVKAQVHEFFTNILPEAFQLAADGKLKLETISVELKDISTLWDLAVPNGQRLVVKI